MLCFGFISMASGFGAISIPLLFQNLLETYTWRGALLIIGGFAFQMCVCAAVSVPPKKGYDTPRNIKRNGATTKTTTMKSTISNNEESANENVKKIERNASVLKMLLNVVKNKQFLLFAFAMMNTMASFNVALILIIDFYEANGIDRSTAVSLYTLLNISSTLFRLLPGFIVQIRGIPKLALPCVFSLLSSLSLLLYPFAEEMAHYAVLACALGAAYGGVICGLSVTTFHVIGQEKYSTAFGLLLTLSGISNVIAGPIAGKVFIYQIQHNFPYVMRSIVDHNILNRSMF